jgi:hypothetical protein
MADKSETQTGLFSNILAVGGLIILIAITFWGLFNFAIFSKSWFSNFFSLFSASSKSIQVTVPTNKIPSGEKFTLSWKYSPRNEGTYALFYQCREGFQFKATVVGNVQNVIPCGIEYTMLTKDNTFVVAPYLSGTSSLDVPLSIIFIPSSPVATGTSISQARGNASVTIINTANIASLVPPTPEKTVTPPTVRTGKPDLAVRILSWGVIDPISGNITQRPPTSPNDLVAVRFLISNAGGSITGAWYFTALLPTSPEYPYTSPAQTSLAPGASIENMLRFKNAVPGGVFSVSVDPINEVNESNEGNNTATTSI